MAASGSRSAVVALATVLVLAGCAQHEPSRFAIEPPPPGVHSVFVVAHRYHAGIAVRAREVPQAAWPARSDFPDAEFLVTGWGERVYYPHDDPGVWLALRALLTPSASTLHVIPIAGPLARAFSDSEIVEVHVPRSGFERIVQFIRESYELDPQGRAIRIAAGARQPGRFYASPLTFHGLENCNTWVARALHRGGLPVRPETTFTAGSLLRQVRPVSPAARARFATTTVTPP